MSKMNPMDLAFFVLENSSRQMHMAAYQLFKIPARQKRNFVETVTDTYRNSEAVAPFNKKLKWLGKNVASWQQVKPDMDYHVRRVAVPEPGTMKQFYELISFINTPLLDRARPPWECYIIEGIEGNHVAIMIKVHHALIDGGGAMKLFRNAMNDSPDDESIRAIWMASDKSSKRKKPTKASESQVKKLIARLGKLPSDVGEISTGMVRLGKQNLKRKGSDTALPFGAEKTIFDNVAESSARRYANCEIPLGELKTIAKNTGTTVNDVVTTIVDDALHRYLKEHKQSIDVPLVSAMAMSFRTDDQDASGNQVSIELVTMGQPKARIGKRLHQVHESILKIKDRSQKLPTSVRQFYSMFVFGSSALSDFSSALQSTPSSNLIISNMVGPREQLYTGGFPMVAFQGLPIVPPGGGLNVTFASFNNKICLAIGAAPEAVDNPYHLILLIQDSLESLKKATSKPASKATSKRVKS